VVVCLEQGADLHMAQLMPLPLAVSCFSKIQIGFTFLVPAHLGSPGKRAVKRVCVCVCVCVCVSVIFGLCTSLAENFYKQFFLQHGVIPHKVKIFFILQAVYKQKFKNMKQKKLHNQPNVQELLLSRYLKTKAVFIKYNGSSLGSNLIHRGKCAF